MPRVGPLELGIILLIIIVLFGVGRLPEVGAGIGKGIREFRRSINGNDDETKSPAESTDKKAT